MVREFVESPQPDAIAKKSGFHSLTLFSESYMKHLEDVNICPFGLDGVCEGIKDPEYSFRCAGSDFSYQNCLLYQNFVENSELWSK